MQWWEHQPRCCSNLSLSSGGRQQWSGDHRGGALTVAVTGHLTSQPLRCTEAWYYERASSQQCWGPATLCQVLKCKLHQQEWSTDSVYMLQSQCAGMCCTHAWLGFKSTAPAVYVLYIYSNIIIYIHIAGCVLTLMATITWRRSCFMRICSAHSSTCCWTSSGMCWWPVSMRTLALL